MPLVNEGVDIRQPFLGPVCVKAPLGLSLLFFVSPSVIVGSVGLAEEMSTAPSAFALKLLNQVKLAQQNMTQECGASVFTDNRGEILCKGHGEETIGAAWNRHLTAVGVPAKLSDRGSSRPRDKFRPSDAVLDDLDPLTRSAHQGRNCLSEPEIAVRALPCSILIGLCLELVGWMPSPLTQRWPDAKEFCFSTSLSPRPRRPRIS